MTRIAKPTRRKFIKTTAAASAAGVVAAPWVARAAVDVKLRIATLAPQNSRWHKAFKSSAREIKKRTEGAVEMKIYAGGVMGGEPAMVRKMRTGQLDGAAITSVGLGDIDKQLLMLQLPLLFKSYKQLDYVRSKMMPTFEKLLTKAGFRMGAPGDVGFIYLFSNTPVAKPGDIAGTKPWVWDADPISKAIMKQVKANAVPLGVPDVLPSLQTGVINAFPASPYAAIALQWYTKAQYVTNLKLSMGIGASVVTLKTWEGLKPEYQTVLEEVTEETHGKLLKNIRRDNKKAVKTLTDKGIQVVEPTDFLAWANNAVAVRNQLRGSLFKPELLDQMLDHLKKAPG